MVSHGEAHPMEMHDGKGKSMRHLCPQCLKMMRHIHK